MKYPKVFLELQLLVVLELACRQGKTTRIQVQGCIKYDDVNSASASQLSFLYRLLNQSFPRYSVALVIIYGAITFLSLQVSQCNFLWYLVFQFCPVWQLLQEVLVSQYVNGNSIMQTTIPN